MAVSDNILQSLEKAMDTITSLYQNMDYSATVTGIVDSNQYQITHEGETFIVPNGTNKQFSVGDTVWIHRPNGSKTKQFILASKDGESSSGSGTASGVFSVDGRTGNVVLSNTYAAKSSEHTHANKSILDSISSTLISDWNTSYAHAVSAHARTDATCVEPSIINGNIKINEGEVKVYELPDTVAAKSDIPTALPASDVYDWAKQPEKPSYTASEVGLSQVDNTSDIEKPVSTAQQSAIDAAYQNAAAYTDTKIADAIGTKANQSELDTHITNDVIHIVASERENWNNAYIKSHEHKNASILDKFNEDTYGNLLYDENPISSREYTDDEILSGVKSILGFV